MKLLELLPNEIALRNLLWSDKDQFGRVVSLVEDLLELFHHFCVLLLAAGGGKQ